MARTHPTVLLIGLGHLGGVLLELLARQPWPGRIVASTRSPEAGEARCNLARLGAIAQGFEPRIEYRRLDISRPEEVSQVLDSVAPDIVISTATMLTWWLPELLPDAARRSLQRARFGMWLPLHLAPTLALMRSIKTSGYQGLVLTAPFPDVVNCILSHLDLAPTCGIGNIDELVASVKWSAARQLEAPLGSVEAVMVAHHALESTVFGQRRHETPPYFLRVFVDGQDISDSLDVDQILFSADPLPQGPATAFFTAGSTVRLLRAILDNRDTPLHVPSPGGLPGGYPVLAGRQRVEVAPIEGLRPEEAIEINRRSHRFDGIESIEEDGTAVFVAESAEIMRTELGYDCPRLPPDEAADRGHELRRKFRQYAGRHGVIVE